MRKDYKGNRLMALLLAATVFMCSFPMALAEEEPVEALSEEVTQETAAPVEEVTNQPESADKTAEGPFVIEVDPIVSQEELPAPDPEPVPAPEPEPEPAPEPAPEPEPAQEPEEPKTEEPVDEEPKDEEPAPAEADTTIFVETAPEPDPDEEIEDVPDEDDEFFEFDDDDMGSVSDDLLEQFNNPETYDGVEFSGTADVMLKSEELYYGREVTLQAKVTQVEMSYRVVWEANDGDERGWFTISGGPEYSFTLTEDIVDREYRVVLFAVD